uniref:Keratin associated protein 20-1 n=1 Tax=Callithrix jacchus TaxID=9483 RepID=A0A2R8M288_CALJA
MIYCGNYYGGYRYSGFGRGYGCGYGCGYPGYGGYGNSCCHPSCYGRYCSFGFY